MKLISSLFVIISFPFSMSAQPAFGKRVDELFFNLPRIFNKSEIGLLFENDTLFTNIRYVEGCGNCTCILADFTRNPVLNYLKDSATISFTLYDSVSTTIIWAIRMRYKKSDKEMFDKQYNEISNYFNEVSYTNKKGLVWEMFDNEQYDYYGDYKSFNDEDPKITIGYTFVPGDKRVGGIYYLSIAFFEKHE